MSAFGGGRLVGGKRESTDLDGGTYYGGEPEHFDFEGEDATFRHREQGRFAGRDQDDTLTPPQEKRRKFAATHPPVLVQGKPLLVVRKAEMLANLTHVLTKYVGVLTGTGKGLSLSSLRDAFQATFSYPINVEGLAGHKDLARFLQDQFSDSVRVRCDEGGNHWIYPVGPADAVVERRKSTRDIKWGRDPCERKIKMVGLRKIVEAKFFRWKTMRDIMVANGQPLPSLEIILGIKADCGKGMDTGGGSIHLSHDGEIEETGSSHGKPTEERIGVHLPHFVAVVSSLFPHRQWDMDSIRGVFECDPRLWIDSDSSGELYIEEREPSAYDITTFLNIRSFISETILESPQSIPKAIPVDKMADRLLSSVNQATLNEMGFTDFFHLVRNVAMSDIFGRSHRTERTIAVNLDPMLNVRNFMEGRMSALMLVDPAGTLPFSVVKYDFEEMFHRLHPEFLGLTAFEARECPYLKDVCKLIKSCSNELFLCPTTLSKFKWMLRKLVRSAPIITGNEDSIPEGGTPLVEVTERFNDVFHQVVSLSILGYRTWESLLNDFRDVCTSIKTGDGCSDFVLFQPSLEIQSPFLESARRLFLLSQKDGGQVHSVAPPDPNSRSSSSTPISNSKIAPSPGLTPQHASNFNTHPQHHSPMDLVLPNPFCTPPAKLPCGKDVQCSMIRLEHSNVEAANPQFYIMGYVADKKLQWVKQPSQFQPVANMEPNLSGKLGEIWTSSWVVLDTLMETPEHSRSVNNTDVVCSERANSQGEVRVQGQNGGLSGFGVEMS